MARRRHRPRRERVVGLSPDLRSGSDALRAVLASAADPAGDEVVALVLDGGDRVLTAISVVDAHDDDTVIEVCDILLRSFGPASGCAQCLADGTGLVLASLRAERGHEPTEADALRWHALQMACDGAGVALRDWFVVSGGLASSMGELHYGVVGWGDGG